MQAPPCSPSTCTCCGADPPRRLRGSWHAVLARHGKPRYKAAAAAGPAVGPPALAAPAHGPVSKHMHGRAAQAAAPPGAPGRARRPRWRMRRRRPARRRCPRRSRRPRCRAARAPASSPGTSCARTPGRARALLLGRAQGSPCVRLERKHVHGSATCAGTDPAAMGSAHLFEDTGRGRDSDVCLGMRILAYRAHRAGMQCRLEKSRRKGAGARAGQAGPQAERRALPISLDTVSDSLLTKLATKPMRHSAASPVARAAAAQTAPASPEPHTLPWPRAPGPSALARACRVGSASQVRSRTGTDRHRCASAGTAACMLTLPPSVPAWWVGPRCTAPQHDMCRVLQSCGAAHAAAR